MFDFLVIGTDKSGYYDEIKSLGGEIFYVPPRRKGFINYHRKMDEFFKQNASRYEVIHMQGLSLSTIAPLYYAKKYGIQKRLMHVNGTNCNGRLNRLFHYLNKYRITHVANTFLSCSKEAGIWGYNKTKAFNKFRVIPNGIDVNRFSFNSEARTQIRSNLSIKPDDIVFIHTGSFNNTKNHKFLIDLLSCLKKEKENVKLICVGDGTLLASIKEYASQKQLSEEIYFVGQQSNIQDYLSAADAMIFPSIHEGLGMSAIEAQINGLPVYASMGVPSEAKILETFNRIDLQEGTKYWCERILKDIPFVRAKAIDPLNYSIKTTVDYLLEIY